MRELCEFLDDNLGGKSASEQETASRILDCQGHPGKGEEATESCDLEVLGKPAYPCNESAEDHRKTA